MKFCTECGARVSLRAAKGETLAHYVCEGCHSVFFQSPRLVAGCVAQWDDAVLLCRRATDPALGLWALPAGFVETGETATQGACRELLEEAGALVDLGGLLALFNIPVVNQVHIVFRAQLVGPECRAGPETLEVRLFKENEIPWNELAFATTRETLRHYFREKKNGECGCHFADIVPFMR